jgi:amino acid permease
MWFCFLLIVIAVFAIILVSTFLFLVTTSSEVRNKHSSFDKKLLEHCRVRSNPNDVENESEENN